MLLMPLAHWAIPNIPTHTKSTSDIQPNTFTRSQQSLGVRTVRTHRLPTRWVRGHKHVKSSRSVQSCTIVTLPSRMFPPEKLALSPNRKWAVCTSPMSFGLLGGPSRGLYWFVHGASAARTYNCSGFVLRASPILWEALSLDVPTWSSRAHGRTSNQRCEDGLAISTGSDDMLSEIRM